MNLLLLLLIFDLVSGQQYNKHITPIDYEVPHERKLFILLDLSYELIVVYDTRTSVIIGYTD